MSNQKIPCGGFYLGEGLTLSGGVLSSSSKSGIKYVTVTVDGSNVTIVPSESDYATSKDVVDAVLYQNEIVVVKYNRALYVFSGLITDVPQNFGVKFQHIDSLFVSSTSNSTTLIGSFATFAFYQQDLPIYTEQRFNIKSAT